MEVAERRPDPFAAGDAELAAWVVPASTSRTVALPGHPRSAPAGAARSSHGNRIAALRQKLTSPMPPLPKWLLRKIQEVSQSAAEAIASGEPAAMAAHCACGSVVAADVKVCRKCAAKGMAVEVSGGGPLAGGPVAAGLEVPAAVPSAGSSQVGAVLRLDALKDALAKKMLRARGNAAREPADRGAAEAAAEVPKVSPKAPRKRVLSARAAASERAATAKPGHRQLQPRKGNHEAAAPSAVEMLVPPAEASERREAAARREVAHLLREEDQGEEAGDSPRHSARQATSQWRPEGRTVLADAATSSDVAEAANNIGGRLMLFLEGKEPLAMRMRRHVDRTSDGVGSSGGPTGTKAAPPKNGSAPQGRPKITSRARTTLLLEVGFHEQQSAAEKKRGGRPRGEMWTCGSISSSTSEAQAAPRKLRDAIPHKEKSGTASQRGAGAKEQPEVGALSSSTSSRTHLQQGSPKAHKVPEEVWADVFKKLRHDGEVHRDSLRLALVLVGFVEPDSQWIDEVYNTITAYSAIGLEDYLKFVKGYTVRQHQAYMEAFELCDSDGSGLVEIAELAELMRRFGMEPMRHVLEEVLAEVDEDGEGTLSRCEFQRLMELLKAREGFTKTEHKEFMSVYHRFDRDGSGEIDTMEFAGILGWLGYATGAGRVASIIREVDIDGSGAINEREFLMCMRKVREREIEKIIDLMKQSDKDGNGTLSVDEMDNLLRALGYTPDPEAVLEASSAAGLASGSEFDLSQIWQMLSVFRAREGFSAAEAREIQEAFTEQDYQNEGEISTLEVGKLLRSLGYSFSVEVLQQFIHRVDVDGSGRLDLSELRKLVRMYKEQETTQVKRMFLTYATSKESISRARAERALAELGCQDGSKVLSELAGEEPAVPFHVFLRAFNQEKCSERKKFRENFGFSKQETAELKVLFDFYDVDGGGDIQAKEQVKFIEDYFPEMAHDKVMRPKLLEIIKEADPKATGSLKFPSFCRVMQHLRELQDQATIAKEQATIKETGFTVQEVQEFRELFLQRDCGSGALTFGQVREMIDSIAPLGDKYVEDLWNMFQEATGKQQTEKEEVDFPEFLLLIRKLLDTNFANIKAKTQKG